MLKAKAVLALCLAIVLTIVAVAPIFILRPPPLASQRAADTVVLTSGKWQGKDPAFSPDGQKVIFSSNRTGSSQIWIMNALDGSQQQMLTSVSGGATRPLFNSEGNIVSFLWEHSGFSDLCFLYLLPTTSRTYCATHEFHVGDYYSWSPMGNIVAYDNGTSIFFFNLNTNQTLPFIYEQGVAFEPIFGSNGSDLYFSGSNGSQYAIWRANLDGSNLTRLSWTGYDVLPQLSQNGMMLLYLTNYSRSWETWVVNVSTHSPPNNLFQIPPPPTYFFQSPQILAGTVPRFTPNGSEVLVIQDLGNGSTSLVLASLNYQTFPLATGGTVYFTPFSTIANLKSVCIHDAVWSPSVRSILYVSCSGVLYLLSLTSSSIKSTYG